MKRTIGAGVSLLATALIVALSLVAAPAAHAAEKAVVVTPEPGLLGNAVAITAPDAAADDCASAGAPDGLIVVRLTIASPDGSTAEVEAAPTPGTADWSVDFTPTQVGDYSLTGACFDGPEPTDQCPVTEECATYAGSFSVVEGGKAGSKMKGKAKKFVKLKGQVDCDKAVLKAKLKKKSKKAKKVVFKAKGPESNKKLKVLKGKKVKPGKKIKLKKVPADTTKVKVKVKLKNGKKKNGKRSYNACA